MPHTNQAVEMQGYINTCEQIISSQFVPLEGAFFLGTW